MEDIFKKFMKYQSVNTYYYNCKYKMVIGLQIEY